MTRSEEVAAKLHSVRDWLAGSGHEAALFSTQPGVAWVTGGLEDRVVRTEEPALVWALVTETAAFLITTDIEQPRLAARGVLEPDRPRREVRGHVRRRRHRGRRPCHQHPGLACHRGGTARHPARLTLPARLKGG
jgi:hypothetical protein